MTRIAFKKQTGRSSQAVEISSDDDNIRAGLASLYNESVNVGAEIKLTAAYLDEAMMVKKMVFGLGEDVTIEDVTDNYFHTTFFQAGKLYLFLVFEDTASGSGPIQLSGGTTPGGFELFTSEAITAEGLTAIEIGLPFSETTTFFIHDGGEGDSWGGANLTIKSVSRSI